MAFLRRSLAAATTALLAAVPAAAACSPADRKRVRASKQQDAEKELLRQHQLRSHNPHRYSVLKHHLQVEVQCLL